MEAVHINDICTLFASKRRTETVMPHTQTIWCSGSPDTDDMTSDAPPSGDKREGEEEIITRNTRAESVIT